MATRHCRPVNLCFITNLPAMTGSGDMHHSILVLLNSSKCGGATKPDRNTTLEQAYNILIEDLNMLQKERPPA
jgi:hypothetical protein